MRHPKRIEPWADPVAIAWQGGAFAQAQIPGGYRLYASFFILDHILSISRGKANFISIKGVATASLLITTEDIDLHVAMSQNQLLRDALIDRFTAAGVPGASLNAARCSNDL